jgi:hypothetical protein
MLNIGLHSYLLNVVFQEKLGDNGILLYPSHPFPAVYHYSSILRPYNFGYWAVFNVLKLPVTQVPMGLSKDGLPLGIQVHIIIVRLNLSHALPFLSQDIDVIILVTITSYVSKRLYILI